MELWDIKNERTERVIFKVIIGYIIAFLAATLIGGFILHFVSNPQLRSLLSSFLLYISLYLFSYYFVFSKAEKRIISKVKNPIRKFSLKEGILYYFFTMALVSLFTLIFSLIFPQLAARLFNQNIGIDTSATVDNIYLQLMVLFINAVILAPIFEEYIIRATLFNALNTKVKVVWALIISSLFFGILHGGVFIQTGILGAFLAYIYHVSGNIKVPIIIHALNNGISFAVLLINVIIEVKFGVDSSLYSIFDKINSLFFLFIYALGFMLTISYVKREGIKPLKDISLDVDEGPLGRVFKNQSSEGIKDF